VVDIGGTYDGSIAQNLDGLTCRDCSGHGPLESRGRVIGGVPGGKLADCGRNVVYRLGDRYGLRGCGVEDQDKGTAGWTGVSGCIDHSCRVRVGVSFDQRIGEGPGRSRTSVFDIGSVYDGSVAQDLDRLTRAERFR